MGAAHTMNSTTQQVLSTNKAIKWKDLMFHLGTIMLNDVVTTRLLGEQNNPVDIWWCEIYMIMSYLNVIAALSSQIRLSLIHI